ncbi:MAG: 3-isopropylmalate dehydratase [Chloroflexi bacterium]|nr:3-isopropylmalate dehydratase [Chloroflexota bacterium]
MPTIRGRVWKFGDNINTDLMFPGIAFTKPEAEQPKYVFWANRPGWSDEVQPGDVIIGGQNYGTGSSRPAAKQLKALGVAAVVADTVNGLFLRNCVNFGLPALSVPGVAELFEEGETAEIDFENATITNVEKGQTLSGKQLPDELVKLTQAGGILPLLKAEGFLK